jgi:hypothetical protein
LEEYKVKVKNLGCPCIEEHEIGFLPVIAEMKGREVFLNFRSRKLSSSGFAVPLNKIFVNSSGIPRRRMDTKEDRPSEVWTFCLRMLKTKRFCS